MEKKVRSQILFFIVFAAVQTIVLGIFIILYPKPIVIPIVLGSTILVIWLVATLRIISLKMSIKDEEKRK